MTSLRAQFRQLWDPTDILDSIWNVLASRQARRILLLALGVLAVCMVVLPQRPATTLSDPASASIWLESARERLGGAADWLLAVGLLDVAHSLWLRTLLGLLALHLVLAVLDMLRPRQPCAEMAAQSEVFRIEASESMATAELTKRLGEALRTRGYRVRATGQDSGVYADRFALHVLMLYMGMLVAIAGLAISERLAWWEQDISLRPGQVRNIGHGTGLSVRADVVTASGEQTGSASAEHTRLTLLRQEQDVRSIILRGKVPALDSGLAFFAQEPEQVLLVQAEDPSGKDLMLSTPETGAAEFAQVPLRFQNEQSPRYIVIFTPGGTPVGRYFQQSANERYILVSARGLTLRLRYSAPGAQQAVPSFLVEAFRSAETTPFLTQEFTSTTSLQISRDRFVFTPTRYAVIKFGQDYGALLALLGGLLLVAGLSLSLLQPTWRLWMSVRSTPQAKTLVIMTDATAERRGRAWFHKLVEDLATAMTLRRVDSE